MAMARDLCAAVHGSGLNSNPDIAQSSRQVVICWDYHLMGEQGYYCGYWRFTVWIPKADPLGFRLTGRRGNPRSAAAYGLKDYLEEQFDQAMRGVLGSVGIAAELGGGKWRYSGIVEDGV